MKKRMIIILLALLGLLIIGGGIGYYMYQKPVKNFADSEAEIVIPAKELFNKFTSDETKAIAEYVSDDKTVQIKGNILGMEKNSDGTVVISLDVGDPEGDISCTIIKEDSPKAEKYKAGDMITIKGQCTGYQELISKEVIMIRCGIE